MLRGQTEFRLLRQLPLLRAWQLAFARMGKPDAATCARLAAQLDPLFPHADTLVNRELVSLLIYLDSPTVVAKTVPLLRVAEKPGTAPEEQATQALLARNDNYGKVVNSVTASRSDRQQIIYAYNLRHATVGWTPALRREYFSWFPRTSDWKGGNSFTGFIRNIRSESLAHVADSAERSALDERSRAPVHSIVAGAVSPQGPGRAYTVAEATALISGNLTGRNFAQGKAMFGATACIVCHRFGSEGTGIGPDLTGAGSRYSIKDLMENIVEPSKVISDQYGTEQFTLTEGDPVIGRIVGEAAGRLSIMTNPFAPDEVTRVEVAKVKSRKDYPVSMMPPGLINALNPEELKDLVAYVLSGGNESDKMFK